MKLIDLSHTVCDNLRSHPSHPRVVINDFVTHDFTAPRYKEPCKGFATKQLLISDHAGTHVDASSHFYSQGHSIDERELDVYYGPAILLDVSRKELRRPVDTELIQETLERDDLEIRSGDIVLIRAWAGDWGDEDFHHAYAMSVDACRWLVQKGMKAIGVDLGNVDDNADMSRPAHMYLLSERIPIYENLANLGTLPVKRFHFAGFPLKLHGCTGSPVRAVAFVD